MGRKENDKPREGPSHLAYSVRTYGEDQSSWSRIGAAFPHRDGQGLDVVLDSVPVDGRVTLREQQKEEFEERRNSQSKAHRRIRDRSAR